MNKPSTKLTYGLKAMIQLGLRNEQGPIPLRDIAEAENLSADYLEQLVISLRKAGLLRTTRGPKGGLQLGRAAELITAREIVEALEGPVGQLESSAGTSCESPPPASAAQELWQKVATRLADTLEGITLATLCARQRELIESRNALYVI